MSLRAYTVALTAAGGAGVAAASGSVQLRGICSVHAVALDFTGLPATTDTVITGTVGPVTGIPVLTKSNSATDAVFFPRVAAAKGSDGSASILTEVLPVAESLSVALAQGDPAGTLVATFIVHEG